MKRNLFEALAKVAIFILTLLVPAFSWAQPEMIPGAILTAEGRWEIPCPSASCDPITVDLAGDWTRTNPADVSGLYQYYISATIDWQMVGGLKSAVQQVIHVHNAGSFPELLAEWAGYHVYCANSAWATVLVASDYAHYVLAVDLEKQLVYVIEVFNGRVTDIHPVLVGRQWVETKVEPYERLKIVGDSLPACADTALIRVIEKDCPEEWKLDNEEECDCPECDTDRSDESSKADSTAADVPGDNLRVAGQCATCTQFIVRMQRRWSGGEIDTVLQLGSPEKYINQPCPEAALILENCVFRDTSWSDCFNCCTTGTQPTPVPAEDAEERRLHVAAGLMAGRLDGQLTEFTKSPAYSLQLRYALNKRRTLSLVGNLEIVPEQKSFLNEDHPHEWSDLFGVIDSYNRQVERAALTGSGGLEWNPGADSVHWRFLREFVGAWYVQARYGANYTYTATGQGTDRDPFLGFTDPKVWGGEIETGFRVRGVEIFGFARVQQGTYAFPYREQNDLGGEWSDYENFIGAGLRITSEIFSR